jgi:phosphate transport system substrate-binding protein
MSCLVTSSAKAKDISGAGSTFVAPVLVKWAEAYKTDTGLTINYHAVGSGAGVRQIKGKSADFGASDAPLSPEELAGTGLVQFPIVIGGIVPVVNIDGVGPGQLHLTGNVLADIYLGKITKWNDAAIVELNPTLALPNQTIIAVHRSDGSGTTYVFADYLARVSKDWRGRIGVGTTLEFPGGIGGTGNEGVASLTVSTKGAIGYVEYAYAKRLSLAYALLKNHDATYVAPSRQSFQAAAANADWTRAPAFYDALTDTRGNDSWPITGSTFILIYGRQQDSETGKGMLQFFNWVYRKGGEIANGLDYVEIPPVAVDLVERSWANIKLPDGATAWTQSSSTER